MALALFLTAASASNQGSAVLKTGVLQTAHFEVSYENQSLLAVRRFAAGLEVAHKHLVLKHKFREGARKWVGTGLVPTESVAAHEFFHSIQWLGYSLKLRDSFVIEGTAVWAQREVFPNCVECYLEGIEDWLVGGTDVNALRYFYGGYQGGLFWNFLTDRYGGAQLIRRLFEHMEIQQNIQQNTDWPKPLSSLVGKPFLDLWAEFAVALAARQVPDARWLYPHAQEKTSYVPVPVFAEKWMGESFTIEHSNWKNPYLDICRQRLSRQKLKVKTCPPETNILALNSPLAVRHAYGIHFLRITPKSDAPLALHFAGDPNSDFRVHVVAEKPSGGYEIFRLQHECALSRPSSYALLQIVITRGEKGSGEYRLELQPSPDADALPCQPVKVF